MDVHENGIQKIMDVHANGLGVARTAVRSMCVSSSIPAFEIMAPTALGRCCIAFYIDFSLL